MVQRFHTTLFIVFALIFCANLNAAAGPPETGNYIVVLNDDTDSPGQTGREIARQVGGQIGFIYEHALKGFSISVPPQAIEALEKTPNVKYITTDDIRYASEQTLPTGIQRIFADENTAICIDGADDLRVDVGVAVIDTGVDLEHPDLNVIEGVICTGNPVKAKCTPGGDDDHYHGTHVAGTIGAIDNDIGVVGVAPGARIYPVKVLNSRGTGYSSWIIAGIDWVAANADIIEVANMSLGGSGYNSAEYDAIQGAVNAGVAFAVAAGNEEDDARYYSPAAFDNVLTVSALDDSDGTPDGYDTLAYFSNWGSAVDIAAPGVDIESTVPLEYYDGYGYSAFLSGTSMASPHVAGALALLASIDNPDTADDVEVLYTKVKNAGNYNWVVDSDGIQEPLLDVGDWTIFYPYMVAGSGVEPSDNTPPTVMISSPADGDSFVSGTSITFSGTASDAEDNDPDVTAGLSWTSSLDGPIGTGGSFNTVLSDGIHTITAEATDSSGATDNVSITIIVGTQSENGIDLDVTVTKKGFYRAELIWSGASSATVDIYRDAVLIATTENDGSHTDNLATKDHGEAKYQVFDSATCSEPVTVIW